MVPPLDSASLEMTGIGPEYGNRLNWRSPARSVNIWPDAPSQTVPCPSTNTKTGTIAAGRPMSAPTDLQRTPSKRPNPTDEATHSVPSGLSANSVTPLGGSPSCAPYTFHRPSRRKATPPVNTETHKPPVCGAKTPSTSVDASFASCGSSTCSNAIPSKRYRPLFDRNHRKPSFACASA
jgi:hypothetical protein